MLTSCDDPTSSSEKATVEGYWHSVAMIEETDTGIDYESMKLGEEGYEIKHFNAGFVTNFYNDGSGKSTSKYDDTFVYIKDVLMEVDLPYKIENDTLKIDWDDFVVTYVRYSELFPPTSWGNNSEKSESLISQGGY